MAETIDRLIKAVQPPEGDVWRQFLPIHGYLVSAVACLCQSRALLAGGVPRRSSWGPGLFEDFRMVTDEHGNVTWSQSENTTHFGFELFLNTAQSNIAAAVDATTNAWIISRLTDVEETTRYDESLLWLWIGGRLRILESVLPRRKRTVEIEGKLAEFPWFDPPPQSRITRGIRVAHLRELWRTFELYYDTRTARQAIHDLAGRYIKTVSVVPALTAEEDREQILIQLWNDMEVNRGGSAAIVLARVNAFKHQTQGVSDRYDFVYAVEWVITAKALQWISAFWKVMVQDMESMRPRLT